MFSLIFYCFCSFFFILSVLNRWIRHKLWLFSSLWTVVHDHEVMVMCDRQVYGAFIASLIAGIYSRLWYSTILADSICIRYFWNEGTELPRLGKVDLCTSRSLFKRKNIFILCWPIIIHNTYNVNFKPNKHTNWKQALKLCLCYP